MNRFEDVRNWSEIRGIGGNNTLEKTKRLQAQYQRVIQEVIEIHEAIVLEDYDELEDAIGDTMVTLINLAKIHGTTAEECLEKAFSTIELRKGLTRDVGDFIRYGKLSKEEQLICDKKQGNPGNEYFLRENISTFTPSSFKN